MASVRFSAQTFSARSSLGSPPGKWRERRAPFVGLLAAWLLASPPAALHAQLVADGGTTNITIGINLPGNLIVGTNTGNTSLNIIAPGAVTNAVCFVGLNDSSSSNKVTVQNTNAIWRNTGDLQIGTNGAFNSLVISNGGAVFSANAFLGFNASGSNNQATVTGPGSVWNGGNLFYVGGVGSFNTLLITNAGVVTNVDGYVGNFITASNNQVTVTGTNSAWNQAGNLTVGYSCSFSTLLIANGARVSNQNAFIGSFLGANNNQATVTGAGSRWDNNELRVGHSGWGNRLVVSNGATVASTIGYIGTNTFASNNLALITGAGSLWTNSGALTVGLRGSGNQLVVSNGATVANTAATLGDQAASSNNAAIVTGSGSLWRNSGDLTVGNFASGNLLAVSNGVVAANNLYVGRNGGGGNRLIVSGGTMVATNGSFIGGFGSNNLIVVAGAGSLWTNGSFISFGIESAGNQLVVSNAGTVFAPSFVVGLVSDSTNNRVTVDGGTVRAGGGFEVRHGTNVLNAGLIESGQLLLNNGAGFFEFNGGTLGVTNSTVTVPFLVGNGVSFATNQLRGNGFHQFSAGLVVTNNAWLTGNGTINGTLTVTPGGSVAPGNSVGQLVLNASPSLNGALLMEISKPDSSTFTNDQIQVSLPLTYGGSLTVTHLGPTALASGDVAPLFNATSYAGAFTSISLPTLGSGLMWTNRLLFNGSLAVVVQTPPAISGATKSGTNLLFNVTGGSPGRAFTVLTSTNVTLSRTNWTTNSTGNFDWLGNVTVTNTINSATPLRFFTIRTP